MNATLNVLLCRLIAFEEIAETSMLPPTEVELLLMKAMSLGLIEGRIDEVMQWCCLLILFQVDQTVSITWALPHALDLDQITVVKNNMCDWQAKTKETIKYVEDRTVELLDE